MRRARNSRVIAGGESIIGQRFSKEVCHPGEGYLSLMGWGLKIGLIHFSWGVGLRSTSVPIITLT
jgi:hypothetical protein